MLIYIAEQKKHKKLDRLLVVYFSKSKNLSLFILFIVVGDYQPCDHLIYSYVQHIFIAYYMVKIVLYRIPRIKTDILYMKD